MASDELSARTSEITRILAANGWGIVGMREVNGARVIDLDKVRAAIVESDLLQAMRRMDAIVAPFRWSITEWGEVAGRVHMRLMSR